MAGCLASGLVNSAFLGLTPLYGTRLGLDARTTVWLLTAFQLGSFLFQWPLGRLSDQIDRRLVIAGCAIAVAILSVVTSLATAVPALLALYLLLGGTSLTFYAVAIAHASDFAQPDQMVGVSSSLLLSWAAGAAIGPTIAAPFMDLLGPRGLFLYTVLIAAGLASFVLWRMSRRASPRSKDGFVDIPTSAPRLAEIDPRVLGRPDA